MDERARTSVRGSAARCPYCHDTVGEAEPARACEVCGAVHHAACWLERCASCRFPREGAAEGAQVGHEGLSWGRREGLVLLGANLVALATHAGMAYLDRQGSLEGPGGLSSPGVLVFLVAAGVFVLTWFVNLSLAVTSRRRGLVYALGVIAAILPSLTFFYGIVAAVLLIAAPPPPAAPSDPKGSSS